MKVLITAPSLDETRNVSGISTVARQIIQYSSGEFDHFEAGRKDGSENKLLWLARQLVLPLRFLQRIRSSSPDVVHINTAMTVLAVCRDAVLVRCARFTGTPVILSVHGGENLRERFNSSHIEKMAGRMLGRAERVLVLSDDERTLLRERWPAIDLDVLPNAISLGAVEARTERNGPPVVVFLGRMHQSKGLDEVIDACRILKSGSSEFLFRAYGDGPMRKSFVGELQRVLGSSFEYGGVVSGTEKWKALAGSDIFVLPSAFEGLSMALLEAMAAGCIVVASDIPAIRAIIRDGQNGYLVEPKNSDLLAAVLGRLLNQIGGCKPLRENAAATIRDHFEIGAYVEKLERIYDEVSPRDK
ncbi:MAG: glycosyltransferase family 4 protein [Pyrinomonadaceae bacterium]|nr:glycosyltransferase family 4 protein [Acidobacteriota bacterium]MBP7374858.1 glycosyltransferase family 4 protein [Pyrinomonadaceae bacterium]